MGFLRNILVSGTITAISTAVATAAVGKAENDDPSSPFNAASHGIWGEEAVDQDGFSYRYTGTGLLVHVGAMLGWAALQEVALGSWVRSGPPARAVTSGVATSAAAYAIDYHVLPKRLTPGIERRLSPAAMGIAYGVLAVALAVGVRRGR